MSDNIWEMLRQGKADAVALFEANYLLARSGYPARCELQSPGVVRFVPADMRMAARLTVTVPTGEAVQFAGAVLRARNEAVRPRLPDPPVLVPCRYLGASFCGVHILR